MNEKYLTENNSLIEHYKNRVNELEDKIISDNKIHNNEINKIQINEYDISTKLTEKNLSLTEKSNQVNKLLYNEYKS